MQKKKIKWKTSNHQDVCAGSVLWSALKHHQAQRMTEVEMRAMPQYVPYTLLKWMRKYDFGNSVKDTSQEAHF